MLKSKRKRYGSDVKTQVMLMTWDKTRCKRCGRVISMLNSVPMDNGEYFICKGCKNG